MAFIRKGDRHLNGSKSGVQMGIILHGNLYMREKNHTQRRYTKIRLEFQRLSCYIKTAQTEGSAGDLTGPRSPQRQEINV